ncbi:uncharacterized protein LOC105694353 isoform X2 [Orussus abietinus]|uniref:uncharacterized protein LOC105694353 isoform X2 n=1 Tax=Orussus abietinus TaxID=222816 RepID=UPI00062583E7|nr:uncharacterized protein LOC105694353 isoform X2 [Orussus abietinus]
MSFLLRSAEIDFLNNKDRDELLLSENDDEDDFNFKYVPANQFRGIVKAVRRRRAKLDEERTWASFVERRELEEANRNELDHLTQGMKDLLTDSIEEADRELKRLEEDALPERIEPLNRMTPALDVSQTEKLAATQKHQVVPSTRDNGTGSTNILLSIPEEENVQPSYEKLQDSKQGIKTNGRISSSDHRITQQRSNFGRSRRATIDPEYNSSPELSPERVDINSDSKFIGPDPGVGHRILTIQRRISEILDEISFRLNRIPLPDGEGDLRRRQRGVTEFAIRFSRNYLYDLGRQLADIRRHVRAVSPNARIKPTRRVVSLHTQAIEQKLIAAHQLSLNALKAYCRHIPSCVLQGYPGKLKEILQIVIDLKEICNKVHLGDDHFGSGDADVHPLGKDTHCRCSAILSKLRPSSDNESQATSQTTRSTAVSGTPTTSNGGRGMAEPANRFSMYASENRVPKNRRPRRPNTCPRRDRMRGSTKIVSNSRIPLERLPCPNPSSTNLRSSKEGTRAKIQVPVKEDDIGTVMDSVPMNSAGSSDDQSRDSMNLVPKSRNLGTQNRTLVSKEPGLTLCKETKVYKKDAVACGRHLGEKAATMTRKQLSDLVPVIADLMSLVTHEENDLEIRPVSSASMKTIMEFLKEYKAPRNPVRLISSEDDPGSTYRKSCGIRSGSKNVQLICLSANETAEEAPKFSDASCQADSERVARDEESSSHVSRESGATELTVSEEVSACALEYRRNYQQSCSSSPMYSSNTQNKPWDVVAWIADKLVSDLTSEVSKELQIDDVIRRMFELEFEEF